MKILFGAGNCGKYIARKLIGEGVAVVFVDNDPDKQHTKVEGVDVLEVEYARKTYPDASWIVTIGKPCASEVVQQLRSVGVEAEGPWEYMGLKLGLPSAEAQRAMAWLIEEEKSVALWADQLAFRHAPDYTKQLPCDDLADIYFPDFIRKLDDEHFVDCGAADGDTVAEFMKRWKKWSLITAFEPDYINYGKLRSHKFDSTWIDTRWAAVSDFDGRMEFTSTCDYSSHLGGEGKPVSVVKLDATLRMPPTFIKMDIEGSELEALWGARRVLKEHSPVLAICAYHTSDHLWQIPLLIHAIQPDYKLFLRRYSPGTMDCVWYAVPPERVQ